MTPAPTRALGASAAIVVLVALPLIIAPAKEDKPTPVKGALTVELSGDQGAAHPYPIKTSGPEPAPTESATLRNATGEHTGMATPVGGRCASASSRVAFPGDEVTEWCVELEKIAPGHELTGTLTAGANELALTVHRRDGFWMGPALVLLGGFAAGFAVALVPRWLRGLVRWIVLMRMVTDNERRTSEAEKIVGLQDWVAGRKLQGDTRESLIAAVHRVISSGPARAAAARQRLKQAIEALHALKDHELVKAAGPIANAAGNKITDFFSGGEERKQHPADDWAAALGALADYRADLDDLQRAMGNIEPDLRGPSQRELDAAEEAFKQVKAPDDLTTMAAPLDAVRVAINHGLAETNARIRHRRAADGETVAPTAPQPHRIALETLIPLGLSAGTLTGWALIAQTATAILVGIALVYAFFTIKQAGYDAKPLFHADSDYLALFSAALASGAAATILGLVGSWRPVPGEDADA
jgi:hypothetical protein